MRCVTTVLVCFIMSFPTLGVATAADQNVEDESPEELCERLTPNPFTGFGPGEWSQPFRTVDFYRAAPACTEAMEQHPNDPHYALGAAMAYIAGKKPEKAKPLLGPLIAKGDSSAMLTLAYISPEPEAADLMRKAGDAGNPNGTMLYGMTLLTGKGVPKDAIDGVRMVRRAAEAGSTRAMLILANFYNQGAYGVGLNPREASRLIKRAAHLGDPAAKDILARSP